MSYGKRARGKLDLETLRDMIEKEEVETVIAAFPDMYGRLLGKRITGHFFLSDVLDEGLHACSYTLACDMEMDVVPGYRFANWEKGYGDIRFVPDLRSLRVASWLDETAIVLCDVCHDTEDELVAIAPRTVLIRQMERAKAAGFLPMGGDELEMFIFRDSFESAWEKGFQDLLPFGQYIEDYHILQGTREEEFVGAVRRHLDRSGVPVEFSKGEAGTGQHEINLRYADFLEMADRTVIFKQACKDIAIQQGLAVTFMAKWHESAAGNSQHIHASLWDLEGSRNLFVGEERLPGMPVCTSPLFRWYVGGLLAHARELTLFFAPYVNSYKRYQAGSWAPTRIAWSYDNRSAGFRVVGHGNSLRVECRIPGGDANPYLVLAAVLAAGLEGVENHVEPTPAFTGNVYTATDVPQIPTSLKEATHEFENGPLARRAFGEDVVEHYAHFAETEQRKFDEVVTSWERARFFERA